LLMICSEFLMNVVWADYVMIIKICGVGAKAFVVTLLYKFNSR
jgi:hypothetical protein